MRLSPLILVRGIFSGFTRHVSSSSNEASETSLHVVSLLFIAWAPHFEVSNASSMSSKACVSTCVLRPKGFPNRAAQRDPAAHGRPEPQSHQQAKHGAASCIRTFVSCLLIHIVNALFQRHGTALATNHTASRFTHQHSRSSDTSVDQGIQSRVSRDIPLSRAARSTTSIYHTFVCGL